MERKISHRRVVSPFDGLMRRRPQWEQKPATTRVLATARIDHYQNARSRLTSPMTRMPDGSY